MAHHNTYGIFNVIPQQSLVILHEYIIQNQLARLHEDNIRTTRAIEEKTRKIKHLRDTSDIHVSRAEDGRRVIVWEQEDEIQEINKDIHTLKGDCKAIEFKISELEGTEEENQPTTLGTHSP